MLTFAFGISQADNGLIIIIMERGHATPIVTIHQRESKPFLKICVIIPYKEDAKIGCRDDPVPASSNSRSKFSNGLDSHE